MYLADFHTHTRISFDSTAPLEDMAMAAVGEGLAELCVTDHCDLLDENGFPVSDFDWYGALAQYRETAPVYAHCLKLKLGLELGMGHVDPDAARRILDVPELDFVIGSIHNLSPQAGGTDFYYRDHSRLDLCYDTLDDYFGSMAELAVTDFYDVLGHIIYPLRYMSAPVTLDRYWDRIDAILRAAAERGRGVELNTYKGQTIAQWKPVLERWRACGGEIVTLGSDAHAPEGVGGGFQEAGELLKDIGFRYLATYDKRRPEMHRL